MGVLSMNPDNPGLESAPKLSKQIAETEEYFGPDPGSGPGAGPELPPEEDPEPKKMKLGSFELDTTYPRTLPGFIRLCQVLLLVVSFICLIIKAGEWTDQGTYTFFCLFLIFGALISGYLFFTILAGLRGETFCGFSWILVELIYFVSFGFLIFIGCCLAANKAGANAALQASAVFGFGAVVTFIYYIWVTWKLRRKGKSEDEKPAAPPGSDVGDDVEKRTMTPGFEREAEDCRIDMERIPSQLRSRRASLSLGRQNHSLPMNMTSDQIYENHTAASDEGFNPHRRRHSASEKDSAYSDGDMTPSRGRKKVIPPKMRRTASAYDAEPIYDLHNVLQKQPLAHMSHRSYGGQHHDDLRRSNSVNRRTGYGYPRELSTSSFSKMGFNNDGSPFEEDDLHRTSGRGKSMPDWLRAALGNEVAPNDVIDDESEIAMPPMKRVATLPVMNQKEFPLLNTSDEESVNYPSISRNGRGGFTMPHHSMQDEMVRNQHHQRTGHRRSHHHHGKRHRHHRHGAHHHHGGRHHGERMRRQFNGSQEDYIRQMMESDELVAKDRGMRGFAPREGKPIEAGRRRMIPEQPVSIHFPEKSRWDDEVAQFDNQVMEKYLADTQQMRS
ncbi:uncharacterized protein LOC143460649 [Clavelina lepadiformis]|uniref:uncharacterized protein LOC143460649 n=1 Tax=Clavelina lepadiformis TaxID=159417 RepID=UPI004042C16B